MLSTSKCTIKFQYHDIYRLCEEWGILTARMELAGRPMPAIDALIAATALINRCILVTRNMDDFEETGVEIINPWE